MTIFISDLKVRINAIYTSLFVIHNPPLRPFQEISLESVDLPRGKNEKTGRIFNLTIQSTLLVSESVIGLKLLPTV